MNSTVKIRFIQKFIISYIITLHISTPLIAMGAKVSQKQPPPNSIHNQKTETPFNRISAEKGLELHQATKALFLDARAAQNYENEHIPNAIWADEKYINLQLALENVPKNQLIVAYCYSKRCRLSHSLAKKLKALGFTNIVILDKGSNGWKEQNFPLSTQKLSQEK